ncbi:MAG: hypothetical protein ACF8SC_08130 [Phycisphaerales bacterium JB037]
MLKFLRKYNKILLVVGGSFLMVSFMAPQAIQNLGNNPETRTVATMGDATVSAKEMELANRQRTAVQTFYAALKIDRAPAPIPEQLRSLFPNGIYDALLQQANPTLYNLLPALTGVDQDHWFLLAHAAKEAGYVGEDLDGATWGESLLPSLLSIEQQYQQYLRQFGITDTPMPDANAIRDLAIQRVEQARLLAAREARLPADDLDRALATARGIQRMWDDYLGLNRVSDRDVVRTAADRLEVVSGDYILIPSDLGEARGAASMDDLRAFFEEHRSKLPSEDPLGVGYVLPPRVKLEFLTINRAAIEEYIKIADPDVRTEFRLNRDKYPADEQQAFEIIRTNLKRQRVTAAMQSADEVIREAVNTEVFSLARDGGYRVLPADWSPPRMEELRSRVWRELDREFGRGPNPDPNATPFPAPEVTVLDNAWQTRSMLAALGLGNVRVGVNTVPFHDLVFSVRAIAGSNTLRLQVGIPAIDLPVRGTFGDVSYFTILDARVQSPADTFEEVRDRVARDYAELAGYRSLTERLDELRATAVTGGLDAVTNLFPETATVSDEAPVRPIRGSFSANRSAAGLGVNEGEPDNLELRRTAGADERLPDAIFAAAKGIDPTADPETIPLEERAFAVALPTARSVLVGVINRDAPLTLEQYRLTARYLAQQVRVNELIEASPGDPATRNIIDVLFAVYGKEALVDRYEYEARDDDETDQPAPAAPARDEAGTSDQSGAGDDTTGG